MQTPWAQFWHDWQGGAAQVTRAGQSLNGSFYSGAHFDDWYKTLKQFSANGAAALGDQPPSLLYDDITTLWAPIDKDDDWSLFHEKVKGYHD